MSSTHRVHFFHLIWSTKRRQNFILPKIQDKLYPYIGGIIRKSDGNLLEIGGIANHIHLLVEISNLTNYITLIRNSKASSTTFLKKEFPECQIFAWQDGYGSFTVNISLLDKVRDYIKNQEYHHRSQTFEQEYIKFLSLIHI